MTRPGIELMSPGTLANTLTIYTYILSIYGLVWFCNILTQPSIKEQVHPVEDIRV